MKPRKKDKKHQFDHEISTRDNPFFKNFGKKALAVLIAVILWFVANVEFDVEKSIDVKIKYAELDPELIITNNPPEEINLRLRGPRSLLSSISNTNIVINLDLANITSGVSKFEIQESQINLPREVDIAAISPAQVTLNVDEKMTKTVRVEPNISLPDKGYRIVEEPVVNPNRVKISGPRIIVSELDKMETNPISIAGEKSKFSIQVPLQSPSSLISIIGQELVRVTVNIEEINLEKEFRDLEIKTRNFDALDYRLSNNPKVDLVFDGPYNLINDLKSNDISVFVDGNELDSLKPGTYKLKVNVDYPNSDIIKLARKSPESINVIIN